MRISSQSTAYSRTISGRTVCNAGLHAEAPTVKANDRTLRLTFDDPQRVISRHRGATLQLLGANADAPYRHDQTEIVHIHVLIMYTATGQCWWTTSCRA